MNPMLIGNKTVVAASTATTAAKDLGTTNTKNLIIYNSGSNPAFVNSGITGATIVFPTTTTGQKGAIIPPGAIVVYRKNNVTDTHLAHICDTALTTTLYIQSGEGE